jgi:type IV pilus assembly protein PilC
MLFNYKAIDNTGSEKEGSIDAVNEDVAINSLQRRGFIISSIHPADSKGSLLSKNLSIFEHVSNKEVVILSRQMATLFAAQVSALRIFRLLGAESENTALRNALNEVSDDLQGGAQISAALAKHPKIFTPFYVSMVRSGEESGKLDEVFVYLADYLDRNFAVTSKAKNALIYPAFIIFTFCAVMVLMFTLVIPKISGIITDSGQAVPIYTTIVIDISNIFVRYGIFMLIALILGGVALVYYARTEAGKAFVSEFRLKVPYVGSLYRKLYLSRIADNMDTMLASGIAMVKVIELTADVVDNDTYRKVLQEVLISVKAGSSLSDSLSRYPKDIPGIMTQMVKIGEETGELGKILDTLAKFYQREVVNAVDTLVDLIEPVMIVGLGVGVGFLMAAVLVPIYNLSSSM